MSPKRPGRLLRAIDARAAGTFRPPGKRAIGAVRGSGGDETESGPCNSAIECWPLGSIPGRGQESIALRAADVEGNRREAEAVRLSKEAEIATQEAIVQKLAANKLTVPDILNSNLRPTGDGSKEHFLNVLRTRSKEVAEAPIKTIPSVMLDLFSRVHLPTGDPRKITDEAVLNDAYIKKQLGFEDFTRLRKEVADARTPEGEKLGKRRNDFITGVAAQIDKSNPLMGKIDSSGKAGLRVRILH